MCTGVNTTYGPSFLIGVPWSPGPQFFPQTMRGSDIDMVRMPVHTLAVAASPGDMKMSSVKITELSSGRYLGVPSDGTRNVCFYQPWGHDNEFSENR